MNEGSHSAVGKSAGIILLVLIILVGGWFYFIKPTLAKIQVVNAQVSAKNGDIILANQKLGDLGKLKSQLESSKSAVDLLGIAMPSDPQVPEVLVQVEKIAADSNLKITSLSTSGSEGSDKELGGVPITLNAEGTFGDLKTYNEILEKNLRPIRVKSISIGGASEGGDKLTFSFSIEMLYRAPQDKATTTPTSGQEGSGGTNE